MPRIARRFEFDSAHRVVGHEGKCKHLHGHRYVAEVTVTSRELDSLGRVIDFSVLKSVVGQWIDDHWDHNALLNSEDPLLCMTGRAGDSLRVISGRPPYIFHRQNPTAEVIAQRLVDVAEDLLHPFEIDVVRVRVHETPNCYADAFPPHRTPRPASALEKGASS